MSLKQRLKALEIGLGGGIDITMLVRFVTAVEAGKQSETIRCRNQYWNRRPDESVEEFRARAQADAKRNRFGVAVLFEVGST